MPRGRLFLTSIFFVAGFLFYINSVQAAASDVLIMEIMYDPDGADAKHEWVELKNAGLDSVGIFGGSSSSSWRFFDGDNHTFSTSTVLAAGEYLVLAQDEATFLADHPNFSGKIIKSSFILENTSSTLALRIGSDGEKWSEVTYENTWGGSGNNKTLEKKNETGDNLIANWQESFVLGGTPGLANSLFLEQVIPDNATSTASSTLESLPFQEQPVSPAAPSGSGSSPNNYQNIVFISELISDPQTNEKEWVELYNNSGSPISLDGWYLEEGSEEQTKISGAISAYGYFLIDSPKGNLNNSGDIIFLYDTGGNLVEKMVYGSWNDGNKTDNAPAAYDGKSIGRKDWNSFGLDKDKFSATLYPTPKSANLFPISQATSISLSSNEKTNLETNRTLASTSIIISELLPNPKGSDEEKEFIELYNTSDQEIGLAGYKISNSSHKNYFFGATSTISAKGFFLLRRQISKLALKNTGGDSVELFDFNNRLIDKIAYEDKVEENFSYNRVSPTSTLWQWSEAMTPGRENIVVLPNSPPEVALIMPDAAFPGEEVIFDASDTFDLDGDELKFSWDLGDGNLAEGENVITIYSRSGKYKIILTVDDNHGHKVEKKLKLEVIDNGEEAVSAVDNIERSNIQSGISKKTTKKSGEIINIPLSQIKNLAVGDKVITKGNVSVSPGVFSTQMFYLFDEKTRSGIGVYMFKKDFPEIRVGDFLEIKGELGSYQSTLRVKIKEKKDIDFLATSQPPASIVLATGELDADFLSALVEIGGEVVQVSSGQFVLADEEGELLVQLKSKTGLKSSLVREGDKVLVRGILGQGKNGFQLWPRNKEDIKIVEMGLAEASNKEKPNENKDTLFTATAGGLTSLFLAFLARGRGALAKGLVVGALSRAAFWRKKDKMLQ